MEYRLWFNVPGLPLGAEGSEAQLVDCLEAERDVVGPTLGWRGDDLEVTIGLDADSEAHAAQRGVEVVAAALHDSGLRSRYPARVEVEALDRAQRQLQLA